jgi:hypothetical protein
MSNTSSNGGSVRCYAVKKGAAPIPSENRRRILQAFRWEKERGIDQEERYRKFRGKCQRVKDELVRILEDHRVQGKRVFGYGASTKGNVLLQYAGIGPQHLIAIADRNPAKWGRKTLGTQIPICSEEAMRAERPDALLILPWHFVDEFMAREESLRRGGTRFIVPLPETRLL